MWNRLLSSSSDTRGLNIIHQNLSGQTEFKIENALKPVCSANIACFRASHFIEEEHFC